MITRFNEYKEIVMDVTSIDTNNLQGLTVSQVETLHKLTILPREWDILNALQRVLIPFKVATGLLSKSHYPTLSIVKFIEINIRSFLEMKITQETYKSLTTGAIEIFTRLQKILLGISFNCSKTNIFP